MDLRWSCVGLQTMDSKQCSLILQQTGVREDDNGQVYGQCY